MFNEPALRKLLQTLGVASASDVTVGQLAPTSTGGPPPASGVQPGTTRPGAGASYFARMGDRATIITVAEYALLKAWGARLDDSAPVLPPTDR